jgi:predicted nucleic acid-binding protein
VEELRSLAGLELVAVSQDIAALAAEIAAAHALRGCDAVYLATALSRETGLVSLDD